MRFAISTDAFPKADRRSAWRDALNDTYVSLDCDFMSDDVRVHTSGHIVGNNTISTIAGSGRCIERSSDAIKKDARAILFFGFALSGRAVLSQCGREAEIKRGSIAFHDSTRPFQTYYSDGAKIGWFAIPKQALHDRLRSFEDQTAVAFGPSTPVQKISYDFLSGLCPVLDRGLPDVEAAPLLNQATELVAMMIGGDVSSAASSSARKIECLSRLKIYIDHHLHRADLSYPTAGAALSILPGQIDTLFALEDTTFDMYVLTQRLEGCHTFLSSEVPFGLSIKDVASMWGFVDIREFQRAFAARFGLAPQDVVPGASKISPGGLPDK